jgi:predicted kinase
MSIRVTILVGNIGTGKSTVAKQIADKYNCVVVNMDSLQQSLSGGEYTKYDKYKRSIYDRVERQVISSSIETGYDIIIDRTNVTAKERKRYLTIVAEYEPKIVCYNFGSGDDYSLARRLKDARGATEERWRDVHAIMKRKFEVPIYEEGFDKIYFVDNGNFKEIPRQ